MKKFINSVDTMLAESLDGFAAAHADIVALGPERKFVRRRSISASKVALISGGGSGHEPLHAGFVGTGMLDAACPGQIFTSPTPDQIVEAAAAVGGKAGVLFIVKNYAGDCMNFEMAAELLAGPAATVLTNDDVAVEKSTHSAGRRGVAGTLVVEKIVGAAAEKGMDLKSCAQLGSEVNGRTRSIGVALTSCTVPAAGTPTFALAADEMEMGVGIHGEPGRRRVSLASADAIADQMVGAILADGDSAHLWRRAASCQRFRRHADDRTLSHVQCREAHSGKARTDCRTFTRRLLCHLARNGRLLDHHSTARRPIDCSLGRSSPYGSPEVVTSGRMRSRSEQGFRVAMQLGCRKRRRL